jgi:hypothetical protein
VPADRVTVLRRAFDATLKDPKFLAAAAQARMDMNPLTGEELQELTGKIVSASPAVIAKVKEAIKIKDVQQLPGQPKAKGAKE